MWRSLRQRIGALVGGPAPAKPEDGIAGLAVLFDRDWYLAQNSDVPAAQSDPLRHFLDVGGFEGRDPNPLFDCAWYLERNPDVRAAGFNPLVHFAKWGWREGRDPHTLFDTRRFLEANPEVESSGLDALAYYLTHWRAGVRPPTPIFRSQWYLERYPDVRAAGTEPLSHYLSIGAAEGRSPNPLFDGKWYREANPDIAAAGENPLIHYLHYGSAEGRPANHLIKGRWYIDRVSDTGEETGELSWKAVAARTAPIGTGFDILADFSDREPAAIERLLPSPELRSHAGGLTLVSREGDWSDPAGNAALHAARRASATEGLDAAVRDAVSRGHHLLILAGGVQPKLADVERLLAVFDADPMIGFVVPRLATAEGILPLLPPGNAEELAAYDRRILDHLSELQFAPEFLSPCVIIRAQLVANIPDFSVHFDTLHGALHATLTWSRRIGYRAAVANRVLLPIDERARAYPELSPKEHATVIGFFPDAAVAAHRFKALSCHRRESLLATALSGAAAQRGRLLLDCSGMRPFHNGTSECVLGILDGLAQAAPPWQIDVLISDEAAAFHRMEERYRTFNVGDDHRGPYTSAVRLSQPWTIGDIAKLHSRALYIYFFIFDTISWDTIYATLHEVEQTWEFAASHADGFYYDSNFTMGRFNSRFAVAPLAQQIVTHLSFSFDEYKTPAREGDRERGHVLIVGNDHDHKALDQALGLLPDAFPTQQFVTIGSRKVAHPNVRSIRSGLMSDEEIDRLFSEARMIVYPSFYEGFGLPIIKGLSDGLDVIARRSELLYEVAANCAPRGRIVPFDDPASMVAAVGQCLAGNAVETLPLGGALGKGAPIGWRDVAMRIFDSVAAAARDPRSTVRDRREAALKAVAPPADAQSWLGRMTE
jgi:glycosyltransferase involved in cell wall biosynthesis